MMAEITMAICFRSATGPLIRNVRIVMFEIINKA